MSQPDPHLFSPLRLGPLTLRNRLVHAPHGTCLAEGTLPSERLRGVRDGRVVLADPYTGEEEARAGVGAIVLATGSRATDDLYRALRGRVAALYRAGACVAPRTGVDAIRDGHLVGRGSERREAPWARRSSRRS